MKLVDWASAFDYVIRSLIVSLEDSFGSRWNIQVEIFASWFTIESNIAWNIAWVLVELYKLRYGWELFLYCWMLASLSDIRAGPG